MSRFGLFELCSMKATTPVLNALDSTKRDRRPVLKLAKASTSCAIPAKAYGQCILANYQDVRKDMCNTEFIEFKNCVQVAMGRKW
ncbi:hypothetical protein RSOLAG1IB_06446 [Rhizoctonia solani AG-1 IB]|uniref:IMS import disulfide relay-system CHCH-CHCH-like Cx9C domain-containing protein n=1 Tax=Thanatephorus cucumeris (strain AG1-IB / isolate 7/3/14) TaxID=1108050 RepID=A0A0B7F6B5_THACB|nr:hypothetical protein RSOLAG1IB_06446 [Rhizoctonia solani AG-1 IB]